MSYHNRNSVHQNTASGVLYKGELPGFCSGSICTKNAAGFFGWDLFKILPIEISLMIRFLPLYIKACLYHMGLFTPYIYRCADRKGPKNVGIVINRNTLLRVVISTDRDILDPRILRIIAEYSILRSKSARTLPRYVIRSMRRDLRAAAKETGWRDFAFVTDTVCVVLEVNHQYCYGIYQAALVISISDNLPEYHSSTAEILRLAARSILVGLLCIILAGINPDLVLYVARAIYFIPIFYALHTISLSISYVY